MPALVAGVACLTAAAAFGTLEARSVQQANEVVDAQVNYASRQAENALTQTFERIRTIGLMLAREPAFASFVQDPRPRDQKIAAGKDIKDIQASL
ncbi:MAG: hypothetical protein ACXVX0_20145, partial [Blastococcus sp.]